MSTRNIHADFPVRTANERKLENVLKSIFGETLAYETEVLDDGRHRRLAVKQILPEKILHPPGGIIAVPYPAMSCAKKDHRKVYRPVSIADVVHDVLEILSENEDVPYPTIASDERFHLLPGFEVRVAVIGTARAAILTPMWLAASKQERCTCGGSCVKATA